MSSSPSPGMIGATLTPTSIPAAASRAIVLIRRCGVATNGSIARALSGSQNGTDTLTPTRATSLRRTEHVEVALDERRLGDDADRVAILGADLEAAARQPIGRLERLVAVGDAGEDHELALPRPLVERLAQQLGRARLDDDLAIEVGARAEAEILVAGARIAVGARVLASAIRIDAVVEADVGAVVAREDRARVVLVDLERAPRVSSLRQVLHLRREPRVGRVGDGPQCHRVDHRLNACSGQDREHAVTKSGARTAFRGKGRGTPFRSA